MLAHLQVSLGGDYLPWELVMVHRMNITDLNLTTNLIHIYGTLVQGICRWKITLTSRINGKSQTKT